MKLFMDENTVIEPKPDTTNMEVRKAWTVSISNLGVKLQERVFAFFVKYKADELIAQNKPPKTTRNITPVFIAAHKMFQKIAQNARQLAKSKFVPIKHSFPVSKVSALNIQDRATTNRYLFDDIDSLQFTKD